MCQQLRRICFTNTKICRICENPSSIDDIKHRDHCHFTGKYRGAAHQGYNINYKYSHAIPVVFPNLLGYHFHFFNKALVISFEEKVSLLPISKEKYISFTKKMFLKFLFIH